MRWQPSRAAMSRHRPHHPSSPNASLGERGSAHAGMHASTAETAIKRIGQCKSRNSWSSRVPAPNKVPVIIGTAAMAPSDRRIKTAAPKAKSSAVRLKRRKLRLSVSDATAAPCYLAQERRDAWNFCHLTELQRHSRRKQPAKRRQWVEV